MVKTILKEGVIVILLCGAILGILSVLFYDYNPIGKVVPNAQPYTAPENIKNELEMDVESDEIEIQNKVYTVEGVDLNIYKKSNTYNPSKENPFLTTSVDAGSTEIGNTVKTNTDVNTGNNSSGTANGQAGNNQTSNGSSTGLK